MDQAGISETDLAAMIESGALLPVVHGADWLGSPPAHIRDFDLANARSTDRPDQPSAPSRAGLMSIGQLLAMPSTTYVVRDLIPAGGLISIYGPPGSGKSFLTMDLVLAIAAGRAQWFGRKLSRAPVAYVVLEGHGGIKNRTRAWLAHASEPAPSNFRIYMDDLSLLNNEGAERFARLVRQELGEGAIIVFDTLSQAMPGGDENSSVDMTMAIRNAKTIGTIAGGPVILVHHTGKDLSKGLRGHTSLLGAVDASIEVSNSNGGRAWTLKKNKDGRTGDPVHFELVPYVVDQDQWGDELESCAVRQLLVARSPALPPVVGKHRKAIMVAIRVAVEGAGDGPPWGQALEISAAAIDMKDNGRRKTVAKETLDGLIISGHLRLTEGKIWPA
jgi:hypothetical protein